MAPPRALVIVRRGSDLISIHDWWLAADYLAAGSAFQPQPQHREQRQHTQRTGDDQPTHREQPALEPAQQPQLQHREPPCTASDDNQTAQPPPTPRDTTLGDDDTTTALYARTTPHGERPPDQHDDKQPKQHDHDSHTQPTHGEQHDDQQLRDDTTTTPYAPENHDDGEQRQPARAPQSPHQHNGEQQQHDSDEPAEPRGGQRADGTTTAPHTPDAESATANHDDGDPRPPRRHKARQRTARFVPDTLTSALTQLADAKAQCQTLEAEAADLKARLLRLAS